MIDTTNIYVASLSDYTAGRLVGAWISVETYDDADSIGTAIAAVLAKSKEPIAEEWAFLDYEGPLSPLLGEYTGLDEIESWLHFLNDHDHDAGLAALLLSGGDTEAARSAIDHLIGCGSDLEEIIYEQYHDIYGDEGLGPLGQYIDWSRVARDWQYNGGRTVEMGDGTTYAFDAH